MLLYYCLPETTNISKKQKKTQKKFRSTGSSVRLVCPWNCVWPDHPRPKWPLIRQVPDHCLDKSAPEAFSRPCNSSAPGTCVRSKMVWSEINSVWPPRPGRQNQLWSHNLYIARDRSKFFVFIPPNHHWRHCLYFQSWWLGTAQGCRNLFINWYNLANKMQLGHTIFAQQFHPFCVHLHAESDTTDKTNINCG